LGFRTPLFVISPFARAGHVAHTVYDHTSILKMVEARWNLAPLGARDAAANNLADALDFTQPPRTAPSYPVPPIVTGTACPANVSSATAAPVTRAAQSMVGRRDHWQGLKQLVTASGWSL